MPDCTLRISDVWRAVKCLRCSSDTDDGTDNVTYQRGTDSRHVLGIWQACSHCVIWEYFSVTNPENTHHSVIVGILLGQRRRRCLH